MRTRPRLVHTSYIVKHAKASHIECEHAAPVAHCGIDLDHGTPFVVCLNPARLTVDPLDRVTCVWHFIFLLILTVGSSMHFYVPIGKSLNCKKKHDGGCSVFNLAFISGDKSGKIPNL